MMSRWAWVLRRLSRRIWVRASLFSLAAVASALLAIFVSPYIPENLPAHVGAGAVDNILGIIASSMLAVTTFSLSTMISAYSAATSNVTPRATKLIMEDSTTQNLLSTFIGSFLFSLVGIIALSTGLYGERGRVVLFGVTILVIAAIVLTLLRWIDHLSRLGRVTETTQHVEAVVSEALVRRRRTPCLGGTPLTDAALVPKTAQPVAAPEIGYVQHVDTGALSHIAGEGGGRIYVLALPGDFVDPTAPVAFWEGRAEADLREQISACFTIGDVRSFDQDPRFGLCVLAEIGSRALSPATNDIGTAIDVIGRCARVLALWGERDEAGDETAFANVFVRPLAVGDLFDDLFTPLARDGASLIEIGIRLQKALRFLSRLEVEGFAENAGRHAREALERAEIALPTETDKARLREFAAGFR